MSNEIKFSVDSLLISELGERLVTKNYIALAELIKNAYDADATQVRVLFISAKKGGGKSRIIITDDGHGMTFEQIRDYWMRIATPNKRRNPISPKFRRVKTGDKGIGRFSCSRLAKKLVLESRALLESGKVEHTKVAFEWDKFKPGETLTEVPNYYERQILSKDRDVGTTLNLMELRDSWTQRDFDVLRRQVLGLSIVTPTKRKIEEEGVVEDPGFNIFLEAPEFEMGIGELSSQVIDAGWGRLRGEVEPDGTVNLRLEANLIREVRYELPELYKKIPGVSFDIAIIFRNKEYLRDTKTLTIGIVDDIFENHSGIRVYLEGFRVYPYGEPGNDWLDINKDVSRRFKRASEVFERLSQSLVGVDHDTAMLKHPSNRNLLGGVHIRNHPKIFEVTLSREGIIENEAFKELKLLIRRALEWATLHYNHFVYLHESKKLEETIEEFEELKAKEVGKEVVEQRNIVDSAINVVTTVIEEQMVFLPEDQREDVSEYSSSALRVIEDSASQMQKEINFLRLIASSGALMWTLIHEARILVSRLDTHANSLEILSSKLGKEEKRTLSEIISELRSTRDRFDNQFLMLQKTGAVKVAEQSRILLKKTIADVLGCYTTLLKDYNIDVEVDVPANLRVGPIFEVELYSIVINLLSNAMKAVIAAGGRNIRIEAFRRESGSFFRVYDDGIGMSKEMRDLVTEPFVADPEARLYNRLKDKMQYDQLSIVGEGSGLGLNIVKNITEYYGKHLRFIDVEAPWITCVEVGLP